MRRPVIGEESGRAATTVDSSCDNARTLERPFSQTQGSVMEISVRRLSEVQIIQLRGAVRLGVGVDNFRQAMEDALAAGDTRMVVNFAEVPMIDSSGIGILVKAMASAKQRGGGVKLVNPSKFVVQTLKLIGVLNLFEVFQDENTAVQSFPQ
jgi:anti-sigma B factor antagonist